MKKSELVVSEVGMAEEAVIRREKGQIVFTIDGQEFPWYTMEDGVKVRPPTRSDLGTLTVTIPVKRILCDEGPWGDES